MNLEQFHYFTTDPRGTRPSFFSAHDKELLKGVTVKPSPLTPPRLKLIKKKGGISNKKNSQPAPHPPPAVQPSSPSTLQLRQGLQAPSPPPFSLAPTLLPPPRTFHPSHRHPPLPHPNTNSSIFLPAQPALPALLTSLILPIAHHARHDDRDDDEIPEHETDEAREEIDERGDQVAGQVEDAFDGLDVLENMGAGGGEGHIHPW